MQACEFQNILHWNPAQRAPHAARRHASRSMRWNLLFPVSTCSPPCPKGQALSPPHLPPCPSTGHTRLDVMWEIMGRKGQVPPDLL